MSHPNGLDLPFLMGCEDRAPLHPVLLFSDILRMYDNVCNKDFPINVFIARNRSKGRVKLLMCGMLYPITFYIGLFFLSFLDKLGLYSISY